MFQSSGVVSIMVNYKHMNNLDVLFFDFWILNVCNNWQTWILRISESEISRVASARCLREADKAEQQEVKKRDKEEKQHEQEKVKNNGNDEKKRRKRLQKPRAGTARERPSTSWSKRRTPTIMTLGINRGG